jgi:hypothetical protein
MAIRTDPPLVIQSVSYGLPYTVWINGLASIPCVGKSQLSRLNLRLFRFETGYIRPFLFCAALPFCVTPPSFHNTRIPVLCPFCDLGWPEEAAHGPQYHGICAQGHERIRIQERYFVGESRDPPTRVPGLINCFFRCLFIDLFFLLAVRLISVFSFSSFFFFCSSRDRVIVDFLSFVALVFPAIEL